MNKDLIRTKCPICNSKDFKPICSMGKEYIETSKNGWRNQKSRNVAAGMDFEKNPKLKIIYNKCSKCGIFFLDRIVPIEDAFAKIYGGTQLGEEMFKSSSVNSIVDTSRRIRN